MTARQTLLPVDLPRSRRNIHRGHVIDAGDGDPIWARLRCANCKHEWEVHDGYGLTELKRGVRCPKCNDDPLNACMALIARDIRIIANGHDVTDKMPLTRAELEMQRPK